MRNGAARVAAAVVGMGVLVLGATVASAAPAPAGTPTPALSATAKGTAGVKLSWHYDGADGARRSTVLVIERGPDVKHFQTLKTIARPRSSGYLNDLPLSTGTTLYRARLTVSGVTGVWSASVSVGTSGPSTTPPTTVAPTTVPRTTVPTTPPTTAPPSGNQPPLGPGQRECPAGFVSQVTALTNQQRSTAGVGPVVVESRLQQASRAHSISMASRGKLDHLNWVEEIVATGYPIGGAGQNAAVGQNSAASVISAWMGSQGHRENILNGSYRLTGVGCVQDGGGTFWWTQTFAS